MTTNEAVALILAELESAEEKWNAWPADPVHAVSVLAEEAGETVQAALDFCYSGGDRQRIKEEAIQAGAMAIRVLKGLEGYEKRQGY